MLMSEMWKDPCSPVGDTCKATTQYLRALPQPPWNGIVWISEYIFLLHAAVFMHLCCQHICTNMHKSSLIQVETSMNSSCTYQSPLSLALFHTNSFKKYHSVKGYETTNSCKRRFSILPQICEIVSYYPQKAANLSLKAYYVCLGNILV